MTKCNQAYLFICVTLPSTPQGYCGLRMRWPKTRLSPQWVFGGIISVMTLLPLMLAATSGIAFAPNWSWWSTGRGWAHLTWFGDGSSDWSGSSTQEVCILSSVPFSDILERLKDQSMVITDVLVNIYKIVK